MAMELLEYNSDLYDGGDLLPLQHDAHPSHDLESIFYVFVYGILKHEQFVLSAATKRADISTEEN
jgi:hypothetical protein